MNNNYEFFRLSRLLARPSSLLWILTVICGKASLNRLDTYSTSKCLQHTSVSVSTYFVHLLTAACTSAHVDIGSSLTKGFFFYCLGAFSGQTVVLCFSGSYGDHKSHKV